MYKCFFYYVTNKIFIIHYKPLIMPITSVFNIFLRESRLIKKVVNKFKEKIIIKVKKFIFKNI